MQTNWIKITEKEPPFDEPILVYCPTGEGHIEPARFKSKTQTIEGVSYDFYEMWYGYDRLLYTVTHWMPLPEPPKEPPSD